MVAFCVWVCNIRRGYRSFSENRHATHQFYGCNCFANRRCSVVLVAIGVADWGNFWNRSNFRENILIFNSVRLCNGCKLALLLSSVAAGRPIDKSSTILTMLLAFLFLGEALTVQKIICMLLIGAGTFLMLPKRTQAKPQSTTKKGWLFYAILSAVFASLTSILGKVGIQNIDSNLGTAIRTCVVLVMAWVMVFVTGQQHNLGALNRKDLLFLVLSGLTTGLSWMCYYRALQDGLASVVVPIDKLSILVTIAFSSFVLKERLNRRSGIGLGLLTVGTVLLVL